MLLDSIGKGKQKDYVTDINSDEIQKEYDRIDNDWLLLHYKTSIVLGIFSCVVELIMGINLIRTELVTLSVPDYILKYIIIPIVVTSIFMLIDTIVIRTTLFSQKQKIYIISFVFVAICFSLFTVHSIFLSTIFIFSIAIMLTIIYASYQLTGITAILSILSILFAEIVIVWDVEKSSIFEDQIHMNNFIISILTIVALSVACMVAIRFEQKRNEVIIQMIIDRKKLKQSLQIDAMTGIYNRKALYSTLQEINRETYHNKYILAISDIDKFKDINDNWGHQIGDRCLIEYARILMENCMGAIPYRYGGDEFCLLFKNRDMKESISICKEISLKLGEIRFEECQSLKLTCSFGLAAYSDEMDSVELFTHSDRALYKAKEKRNTIHIYNGEDTFSI